VLDHDRSTMSRSDRIALVFCPYFSIRSPHLGLARIYTALVNSGYEPDVFDLDTWLKDTDRLWYDQYVRANNIGREFDRVTFILGLEVLLHALYHRDAPQVPWAEILRTSPVLPVDGFEHFVSLAADRIGAAKYDFALFSTYSSNLLFSTVLARELKRRSPIRIIFGGPGAGMPETTDFLLRTGFVDSVVVGEGEATIGDLLENWPTTGPPAEVPGVAILEGGDVRYLPRPLLDLDSLPATTFPEAPQGYAPVETTRGCTMRCAFCSESQYWRTHRQRSVAVVVDEVNRLTRKHGPMHIEFVDSLVNPSQGRLHALTHGLINARMPVDWTCDMRPAPWLTSDLAAQAFRAGCRSVNIGAETLIPRALEAMRKGTKVEWILDTTRHLSAAGIQPTVHRMCCAPGETDDEVLEMYALLRQFKKSISDARQWSRITWGSPDILRVEPYSPMFRDPARWGIDLIPFHLPLPAEAAHLRGSLDAICLHWTDGVPREEKLRRHALIRRLDRVTGLVPG
ncbi:MAG: radical SAM protein, partial [Candidatus Eisenbacteria bacterium]|nr:radical SAM protein [Candidatus Eisenbacteria bacterium]